MIKQAITPVDRELRWRGRLPPDAYQQALIFSLYFLVVVTYQWLGQAYTLTFGAYADEPAHYLTSLMIRDYLVSGFSQTPLQFAKEYYVHYPGIAFGMWGPMLHLLGAIWMVLFSSSRVSILLLIALISASFAWSTQWLVMRTFNRTLGVLVGFAICLIPSFQVYSRAVMADILTGTLMFWAAYYWYRYLVTGQMSMSLRFGLFAILALLTKANAGALVLLPVPATLLAGRWKLFMQRSFWAPVPIVVLFAGPWYVLYAWLMANLTRTPLTEDIAASYLMQSLGIFLSVTIVFVCAGMAYGFFHRQEEVGELRTLWAVSLCMVLSFLTYYYGISGGFETRYVLMMAPWIAILLILGSQWLGKVFWPARIMAVPIAVFAGVVAYGVITYQPHPKTNLPYAQVVSDLLPRRNMPQRVFMMSSESAVETTLVAEVALRDHRPNHFVLRASKMLAHMNWNGQKYENSFTRTEQVHDKLLAWGVSCVIVDTTTGPTPWPHQRLLLSMLASSPDWRLTRRYGAVEIYEFQGDVKLPDKIEVEVPYTLRSTLEAKTGH